MIPHAHATISKDMGRRIPIAYAHTAAPCEASQGFHNRTWGPSAACSVFFEAWGVRLGAVSGAQDGPR